MTHLVEAHFKQKAFLAELNLEWLVTLQGSEWSSFGEAGDPVPVPYKLDVGMCCGLEGVMQEDAMTSL